MHTHNDKHTPFCIFHKHFLFKESINVAIDMACKNKLVLVKSSLKNISVEYDRHTWGLLGSRAVGC